ncbi:peptidase [Azospirillum sp. RWY-5-1]|uniref:Peptidase n=1 Tax=Azospirillum oleiclasticum TaxID=2735135 RepID=A0ABX2T9R5_9PROT|nr:imelysin family protein [Azospirillum oleiclasticum]NYZ12569.1 peptidase [Azospirillum oleiclasticum]NYZ19729.1 peptidase [Azospirillum oleiclasticum]
MRKRVVGLAATAMVALLLPFGVASAAPAAKEVLKTYADIAQASYEDSLSSAKTLRTAIDALLANPTAETLAKAREAWIVARVPYMQTEAFRFGNPIVDKWEGKVNAWPLDEGLIDYTDPSYEAGDENPYGKANVIANPKVKAAGKTIDAAKITKKLLADKLQEAGGVEANVATGYHAIEFLLWGQDLNGTGPGAGNRKATDFSKTDCTNGNCDRRAQFLKVATDLLVEDLEEMAKAWGPKGKARAEVQKAGEKGGIARILTGIGSLSYGELAGERMKLGLILHDPEEEHDCFSDNTHNSHYYDQVGMMNVWSGKYTRTDGTVVTGPSLSEYVAAKAPEADAKVTAAMGQTLKAFQVMKDTADGGKMAYDQMIGAGNAEGNAIVSTAVDRLVDQKKALETVVAALGVKIEIEGSDSLDDPSKVGK